MWWRALLAGFGAALLAGTLGLALVQLTGLANLGLVALLVAPVTEEGAKRLLLGLLGAAWAPAGLVFGLIEAAVKLAGPLPGREAGAVASVALHWALGRWTARSGRGLWVAISLHAAFNGAVLAGGFLLSSGLPLFAAVLALALLAASFLPGARPPIDAAPANP
ncbi:MAG: hypothetical protein K2X11_16200 [Acetobacteraceae bacterium]|nr:hypothetical protein [Acetobacteraceae bacterium]